MSHTIAWYFNPHQVDKDKARPRSPLQNSWSSTRSRATVVAIPESVLLPHSTNEVASDIDILGNVARQMKMAKTVTMANKIVSVGLVKRLELYKKTKKNQIRAALRHAIFDFRKNERFYNVTQRKDMVDTMFFLLEHTVYFKR